MYRIIVEYVNGFVRELIMDKQTWEIIVRNALEENREVVRYSIESI